MRVAQQVIDGRVAAEGDADARGQDEARPEVVELDGLVQSLDHALGQRVEPYPASRRFDQHHELVSAETADGVVRSHHVLQPFPDDPQQLVAGGLSELFVDVLEPVDVDEQGARQHSRIASRARDHALGTVQRERAVGQPGQGVVEIGVGRLGGLFGTGAAARGRRVRGRRLPSMKTSTPSSTLSRLPPISSARRVRPRTRPG